MKEIILELIKLGKEKGLGDVCLFISMIAMILGVLNSLGFHPLDFSHGLVKEVRASVEEKEK